MDRFVIISGCSGAGKSTLLDALRAQGFSTVQEPGRRIVQEQMRTQGDALPSLDETAFVHRVVALAKSDYDAARTLAGEWVFFDRGLIDAAVALEHLTCEATPLMPRFYPLVFLASPWREIYETDDARRHTFEDAVAEYERLFYAYRSLGYDSVILPKVSVQERVAFVLKTLVDRSREAARKSVE